MDLTPHSQLSLVSITRSVRETLVLLTNVTVIAHAGSLKRNLYFILFLIHFFFLLVFEFYQRMSSASTDLGISFCRKPSFRRELMKITKSTLFCQFNLCHFLHVFYFIFCCCNDFSIFFLYFFHFFTSSLAWCSFTKNILDIKNKTK